MARARQLPRPQRPLWSMRLVLLGCLGVRAGASSSYGGPTCYAETFPQCSDADIATLKADARWYSWQVDAVVATFSGEDAKDSMRRSVSAAGVNVSASCAACQGEVAFCGFKICAADGAASPCAAPRSDACIRCGNLHCAESRLCGVPRRAMPPPNGENGTPATWLLDLPLQTRCGVEYVAPNRTVNETNTSGEPAAARSDDDALTVAAWSWWLVGGCVVPAAALLLMGFPRHGSANVESTTASADSKMEKATSATRRRAQLTVLAASSVMAVLAIGQGMLSFVVMYEIGGNKGRAFEYDFWGGVQELWIKNSVVLSLVVGVLSGFWPYLKQVLTIVMVSGHFSASAERRGLGYLGIMGKTAFVDIGIVTIVISSISVNVMTGGTKIFFATIPKIGTWLILAALLGSRVITSALLHAWPPSDDSAASAGALHLAHAATATAAPDVEQASAKEELQDSGAAATAGAPKSKRLVVATWLFASVAPLLVVLGALLPAIERKYDLTVYGGSEEGISLVYQVESLTLWEAVDRCRLADGESESLRAFLALTVLFFGNIAGLIFSFMPVACLCLKARHYRATIVERTRVAMELMGEWASLDALCIGVMVLPSQLKKLGNEMSKDFGYDEKTQSGGMLSIELATLAGFWCSIIGSFLALLASRLVRRTVVGQEEVGCSDTSLTTVSETAKDVASAVSGVCNISGDAQQLVDSPCVQAR